MTRYSYVPGSVRIAKITDPAGRQHLYGYTGNLLTSYTDPAGKVTQYEYQHPGAGALSPLTKIIDPNGNQTRFTYAAPTQFYPALPPNTSISDTSYRLTSVVRVTDLAAGTGPTWSFDYSVVSKTKVTSPNPKEAAPTVYSYCDYCFVAIPAPA